jgi:hypothetical protein
MEYVGLWVEKKDTYLINTLVVEGGTVGDVLAADGVVHVGLDTTGSDGVHRNLLVTKVDSHAPDKGLDGALACRVDSVLGHGLGLARNGAHEDQTTANLEMLVGLAGNKELAARVDVEDTVELLGCDVLDVAKGHDAAVAAHDVELSKGLDSLLEHAYNLVYLTDVGLDSHSVRARLLDCLHDLLGRRVAVGVVDDHLGTATTELHRHLAANTPACIERNHELAT